MNIDRQIQSHLDAAFNLALAELERRAHKVLAAHPNLDEFVMAMGGAFFTTNDDQNIGLEERRYMRPVARFLGDWDDALGLTGQPIRFTATGPAKTAW